LFQRVAGPEFQPGAGNAPSRVRPAALVLRPLLRDAEAALRRAAVDVAGQVGLKECAEDIKPLLADPDNTVQQSARSTLEKFSTGEPASSRVTFLDKTETPFASSEMADEVLLCAADGEMLHQRNCRDAAGLRRLLEAVLPPAEILARHLKLGETRRAVFQLPSARLVLAVTPDGCLMFREKKTLTPAALATETTSKENVAEWLRRLPSARGVLLRGVRFADATILCDVDSRDLPVAAIEETWRAATEIFRVLPDCRRMSWRGERTELHCAARNDFAVLGVLASARPGETDLPALEHQLAGFQLPTA
jgi:hypothetical protein